MGASEIQKWLTYWQNAKMVAVAQILAFDQVHQARRFCACMREGVFTDVTDLQIWRALTDMRKPFNGAKAAYEDAQTRLANMRLAAKGKDLA